MIEIKNIVKNYDNTSILNNVTVSFDEGKIYGIIGKNGSGKSVLLKVMSGFIKPESGEVIYDGIDINMRDEFPKNVGVLLDNGGFIPSLSGLENLSLLASINKKIGIPQINEALERVNLVSDKDKKYYKYSLGMRKKLGICQAIMENQKYILLDEPFNGIDKDSLKIIYKTLRDLKKEGRTIIISTHIDDEVSGLFDEVYKIEDGKLEKAS